MISLTLCRRILLALSVTGAALIAQSCKPRCTFHQNSGFIFGTQYHISYEHTQDIKKGIESHLELIDSRLSTFNPLSTISQINQGKSVALDSLTEHVIRLALSVSHNTNGAFDITVAPLVNAWGFGFNNTNNIQPKQIDSIMSHVGYKKISVYDHQLIKHQPDIMLDCSGIAKGYACDVVADYMDSLNIKNYLIEIGGEIRVKGVNKSRKIWSIGISDPTDDSTHTVPENSLSVIKISDTGLATSGNYRNFYYKNGKKYAHTIDPRTGYPAQTDVLSATVIAPTCAEADAYATAFMTLGLDSAKASLSTQQHLKAYFIYTDQTGEMNTWFSNNTQNPQQ